MMTTVYLVGIPRDVAKGWLVGACPDASLYSCRNFWMGLLKVVVLIETHVMVGWLLRRLRYRTVRAVRAS